MHEQQKKERPFGLEFIEEIPDAELAKVSGSFHGGSHGGGGGQILTEALSIATHGPHDVTIYDQF